MKRCGKCKQELAIDSFSKDKNSKDGTSWRCRSCAAEYKSEYYSRRKEYKQEQDKKYYAANSQKIREYRRKYYSENREKSIEYSSRYNSENKEKHNQASRNWYAANLEKARLGTRNSKARRRASILANGTYLVRAKDLRKIYSSPCVFCNRKENIHADHVIPISRGGVHSVGNLVPACASCNLSRQDRTIMEWRLWKLRA